MTKAFISYHHENDQKYRERLSRWATRHGVFEDGSVEVGDIDENLDPQTIRRKIRDEYLKDTKVTILLCGAETKFRKHVDWELKSSMIDGTKNSRSGILVINLPTISCSMSHAGLPDEKERIYSDHTGEWFDLETKADYKSGYPKMPERIIDNLWEPDVKISVVSWARIKNKPGYLKFLVDATARVGPTNEYDLTRPMRMRNS